MSSTTLPANVQAAKDERARQFRRKGIFIALLSGFLYGGYSAFMTQGMATGVWSAWYGYEGDSTLATMFGLDVNGTVLTMVMAYVLSALGAATNDVCSGIFSLIWGGIMGRLGDFGRTLKTKPGRILILAAIIGGPLASTCYAIGLTQAGSIIIPVAALNAAIGAIIGRFAFKQKLSGGMILGIVICFAAATLIGSSSIDFSQGFSGQSVVGIIAALGAAIGWGIEGAVGGYACCMVDTEVAIIIRQVTAGVSNAVIFVPILAAITGIGGGGGFQLVGQALTNAPSLWMFFVGGIFASFSFKFWYKGAAMCGAAVGMGCNGMYAFWGPLWCFIVCGLIFGDIETYAIPWQGWVGAVVMVIGILILARAQQKATEADAA